MRLLCVLFGCREDESVPFCYRCHADIYEDYIQYGKLDWIFRLRRWLATVLLGERCWHCNKRISRFKRYHDHWCCEKCREDWMPF